MDDQVKAMNKIKGPGSITYLYMIVHVGAGKILEQLKGVWDHVRTKMLYITPEKLCKSEKLNRILKDLDGHVLLSWFVENKAQWL